MGKALTLLAVFTAGYFWGDIALTHTIDLWQTLSEASRIKFEELYK
tara:strand:+ start:510 stop:647 length:138 start_codon:yes stop_codon:yes gene_type:complete